MRITIISFLALVLAGCTQQVKQQTERVTSVMFTPEGIGVSAPWVAADCRLLRVKNADFLDHLGLPWQVTPRENAAKPDAAAQARFAVLTPEQMLKVNREGSRRFEYMPVEDGAAFMLTKAGSTILYSKPQFATRTKETFIDVEVSAVAPKDASALDISISASEIDAKVAALARTPVPRKPWVGSARIPVAAGKCALVQIPTVEQNPAGTRTRMMLLIVPSSFAWRDQRITDELPWGKFRVTSVNGRSLSIKWMPARLLQMDSEQDGVTARNAR